MTLTESAGRDQPRLLGKVGIDIGLHQQIVDIFGKRASASMEQHEIGLAQGRVIEHGFEKRRIRSHEHEVGATSAAGMDVHRQAQASGFAGNIAKQKVLQPSVIGCQRNVAFDKVRINLLDQLDRLGGPKSSERR